MNSDQPQFVLRDYQDDAVNSGFHYLKYERVNSVLVLPTGSGKSLVIAALVQALDEPCLVFQPSVEILDQNYQKFLSYGITPAVYSASAGRKEVGGITLATIGSVKNSPEMFAHVKYVLIDECFIAGTLVDGVPIEEIKPGHKVRVFDHSKREVTWGTVKNVMKNPSPNELCCIRLSSVSIMSTCNHPIYIVGRGYVAASEVQQGDFVYEQTKSSARATLQRMQESSFNHRHQSLEEVSKERGESHAQGMLFQRKWKNFVPENAIEEPNEKSKDAGENGKNTSGNRTQATDSRWQRNTYASTSANIIRRAWGWMVSRIKSASKSWSWKKWVSYGLQNRLGESRAENSYRGGWKQSLFKTDSGCEENIVFRTARVESVEVFKQGCDGRYPDGDFHDYVFNLEIEGRNNNYFANGVLVHNCHGVNAKGGMYSDFFAALGNRGILGLTATPYRLSTDGYGGSILKFITRTRPRVFTHVAHVVQNGELFQAGYLAKLRYKIVPGLDKSKLRLNSTGADFTDISVRAMFQVLSWGDRVVKQVEELWAEGRKNALVFTRFLEEAEYVSSKIPNSAMVSSETSKAERERILREFKAGKIKAVINVGVLVVGFDFPSLEAVVLGAPTMSLARYYQMVGRVVRTHPDKLDAVVVDMVGSVEQFGRVEDLHLRDTGNGKWVVNCGKKQLTNIYFGEPRTQFGHAPAAKVPSTQPSLLLT